MSKLSGLLCLWLLLVASPMLYAQQRDFGAWGYIQLKYKINQKWSVGYTEHHLRNENASERWMNIHDAFGQCRINRFLSHEFHLRNIQYQHMDNKIENRWLIFYALVGSYKIQKWQLSMRSRWQQLTYEDHWNDAYKGPYYYHRLKTAADYIINYHWRLGGSTEWFMPLNRPNRSRLDQVRWTTDLTYRKNQHLAFDFFYQIQQPIGRSHPRYYFILGTGIHLTL